MKPLSISLSPNVEKDDVRLALKVLFKPWRWKRGSAARELEAELAKYLGIKHIITFNSGRTSLMAILGSLGLAENSEALAQAFTCNASVNPFIWSKIRPVYVDCQTESYNMDISDLKLKIGPKSRVLMVQHTFGLPADMDEIGAICREKNLILIEDCAHSLGAEYRGVKVGNFGKASFFSFGRDKIISSVWGGATATNDDNLEQKIRAYQEKIKYPSYCWILRQLLHPILMNYVILPLYNVLDLGKVFLVLSQWSGVLSKAVNWQEKKGKKPAHFPLRLPNALAILALHQFKKIDKFYQHRKKLAQFYYDNLETSQYGISLSLLPPALEQKNTKHAFLRFTVRHPKAHEIIYNAWHKENIIIGDWYTSPIIPVDTDLASVGYTMGSCPNVEKLVKTTFNLPTHINISIQDAQKIVEFLRNFR